MLLSMEIYIYIYMTFLSNTKTDTNNSDINHHDMQICMHKKICLTCISRVYIIQVSYSLIIS